MNNKIDSNTNNKLEKSDKNSSMLMKKEYKVDFCVIGGGLAGMFAAIAAARHGAKVVLMHDRPVLGGNASSEIRMSVGGAGKDNKETGILEEIALENFYRNPYRNYSIWDSILYEKVKFEPNITLLLNCTCNDLAMDGNKIKSIKGWQLTTYTWHTVYANIFADCSGDSILAPLSGAIYRKGREASTEFNEDIAPPIADNKTMGLSCLIQARHTGEPRAFIPPFWANKYLKGHIAIDTQPYRKHNFKTDHTNFWWMELGGNRDTIHDTEEIRDELLKVAFGVWDHVKNEDDHGAEDMELSWVGFLPGKRESIRYVGDHIMTQNDVRAEGRFDDIVAYGGWSMDDHHPDGIEYPEKPTIFHPAPSPYGIPYRCLYSKNIENLMFAGRNISTTHAALSSSRVIATCAVLGQAAGTAAYIATKYEISPRAVYEQKIDELKQTLMNDDCYLPFNKRKMFDLSNKAQLTSSEGDPTPIKNGIDRRIGDVDNAWIGHIGSYLEYSFDNPEKIKKMRFVFDSDLSRSTCTDKWQHQGSLMNCGTPRDEEPLNFPKTLIKAFRIEAKDNNGNWKGIFKLENNHQRLVWIETDVTTTAVRFIAEETWGQDEVRVFSWDIN